MTDEAVLEGEVVEDGDQPKSLAVREQAAPLNLFGTQDPNLVIEKATATAKALKDVVQKQGLIAKISGKEHPQVEAWTLLGSMLGVFAVVTHSDKVLDGEGRHIGWEAHCEARTISGAVVGGADAECLRTENSWRSRDDYALRSMAQTRAVSKALRMPLGFVMQLAGYNPTPAEEMGADGGAPDGSRGQKSSGSQAGAEGAEPAPAAPPKKATEAQIKKLLVLANKLGYSDEERKERAAVESFKDLTRSKASALIEAWQKDEEAKTSEADAGPAEQTSLENPPNASVSDPTVCPQGGEHAWTEPPKGGRFRICSRCMERERVPEVGP